MNSTRHIIFGLDGTLVDSLPGIEWSVREALALCGLPPLSMSLKPLIGSPIRSVLAELPGVSGPEALDRLEQGFRLSYESEGWRKTDCYPGVRDVLWRLLTGGDGLYVVTNKPFKPASRILRELKLDGFFREIVCRDSRIPPYASKTEALSELLLRHGLAPDGCLLVGDTREDASAAQAAGMHSAIVEHGYGGADIHQATVSFRSLAAKMAA